MAVNFKPAPPIRNKKHLDFIRTLPCVICGGNSQAHHLLRTKEKCMGRRSGDNWAISLCPSHHAGLHRDGNEERYLAPIDGPVLASALWGVMGNREGALNIIRLAREAG
jgi:hypothetical protein